MKKAKKVAIILAISMIVIGLISSVSALASVDFDLTQIDTVDWTLKLYEIEDEFVNISIEGKDAVVHLMLSDDNTCKVLCSENNKIYNVVTVVDNTLIIERVDDSQWYDNIGVSWEQIEITVYLPETEYEKLFINNTSGRLEVPTDFTFAEAEVVNSSGSTSFMADVKGALEVENTSGNIYVGEANVGTLSVSGESGNVEVGTVCVEGDVDVSTTSGGIALTGVTCDNLTAASESGIVYISEVVTDEQLNVSGGYGSLYLTDVECTNLGASNLTGTTNCTNVIALEEICIVNNYGGINFEACDAAELALLTFSGNINGTLLTEKIFIAKSGSGSVDVPDTTSGGECKLSTNSGNIKMSIVE